MKNLSANQVHADLSRVVLLDVRTPAEYGEAHIPGSHLIPLHEFDPAKAAELKAGDATLCIVCRSGKRALQAAEKLAGQIGAEELAVLEGGIGAWDAAGLPLNRGKAVLSLERQVRIAAGSLVLLGVLLGFTVHAGFFGLCAFVGAGLVFAGLTDWCGMGMLLARMPWNNRNGATCCATN